MKASERLARYVNGVGSGELAAPVFIRRAVERWHEACGEFEYQPKALNRAARLIEALPCPEGAIQRFQLFDWQCFLLGWLFGLYQEDGQRAIRELLLVVPRKAGKSSLLAASALVNVAEPAGDVNAPQILCCGVTEDTANITFEKVYKIVQTDISNAKQKQRSTGKFARRYGMKETQTRVKCQATNGEIRVLTLGAKNLEGFTPTIIICDEISRMPDRQPLETLRSGFGAAHSPQLIMTTTPSDLNYSAYDDELIKANRWLHLKSDGSEAEDDFPIARDYVALIYAATEKDDPSDRKVWERTQPSYHFLAAQKSQYEAAWRSAQVDVRSMHAFKTRQLCIPARLAGQWITSDEWDGTDDPPEAPERADGWWTFIGIDPADVRDMTSICILQSNPVTNKQRCWWEVHYPQGSLPSSLESGVKNLVEGDALGWAEEGWLEVHPGDAIDHSAIADRLVQLNRELNPLVIVSDQYSAIDEIRRHCSPPVKQKIRIFSKNKTKFTSPIATLAGWVHAGSIAIQKNPVAERHFKNCMIEEGKYGGLITTKVAPDSPAKIDCIDALLVSVGGWLNSQDFEKLGSEDAPHPPDDPKPFEFQILGMD